MARELTEDDVKAVAEATIAGLRQSMQEEPLARPMCSLGLTEHEAERMRGVVAWMDRTGQNIGDIVVKSVVVGIIVIFVLGIGAWIKSKT